MPVVTVQVFEHQKIRVGEPIRTPDGGEEAITVEHHCALAAYAETNKSKYFNYGPRTVRFSSYVGLIQLGNLGIEVLPKAAVSRHKRIRSAAVPRQSLPIGSFTKRSVQ